MTRLPQASGCIFPDSFPLPAAAAVSVKSQLAKGGLVSLGIGAEEYGAYRHMHTKLFRRPFRFKGNSKVWLI